MADALDAVYNDAVTAPIRPHDEFVGLADPSAGGSQYPSPALTPRADDGIRTRDPNLGKVVLYQLSHVRVRQPVYKRGRPRTPRVTVGSLSARPS